MKHLLLIRHAKSSWSNSNLGDFDRDLNDRGRRDAPVMAQRLTEHHIQPDALVSSTALRAMQTAIFFARTFHKTEQDIMRMPELYHAPPPVFYKVISELPSSVNTAAVFAHNPGITAFVNELTATRIDDMPTCAVFGVKVHADTWADFAEAEKTFWFFDYPKLLG
ncbi:SixA phosphatase family protein [Sediminibacterium ginsengisoli]|uniref:Phosphohistidine phosphatase n=1 Tax=Sediminibacterium ginsengisoli TaxID=413434 RepID=A0A1T4MJ22_9BACT|nr:histidine phosphatase family protein [Sediminibacterium ginsengisoli]SJZ66774.1 phosphohistidine phosphatase [Sediminibacterium ginsengisoli]